MYDEEILSVKGGRKVKDDHQGPADEEAKREDPVRDNYPACTMPLSATAPLHVTPEILCNQIYAQEYIEHVALIRELLDQASLSTNSALLMRSSNKLLKSLGGLLKGASDCDLAREPLPPWNLVKVVRTNPEAEMVRQTLTLMAGDENISINLPSAPRPMPEGDATRLTHPALVTHLSDSKPYYMKGGLMPHLTKKGYFWKSTPPAIHFAVLKYRLRIDPAQSAHLKLVEQIDCGWTAPLRKMSDYDSATGLHYSLGQAGALQGAPLSSLQHSRVTALSRPEWQHALIHGDLPSLQQEDSNDPLIFGPTNNTEFLNVAAYLEAFWGYIWPTASHNNVPPHDEWKTIKHGGLKEFIDHIVCTIGRAQLKPTTECLRGVTTYPSGDQRQGRYNMTLTDLMNQHYTRAVREALLDLILGRSDNIVKVGDLVEMLSGISFAVKDAMLDWEWLGIDSDSGVAATAPGLGDI